MYIYIYIYIHVYIEYPLTSAANSITVYSCKIGGPKIMSAYIEMS